MAKLSAPPPRGSAIVLFDGVCHLCSGFVRFVIRHDRHHRFRFASLQSPVAAAELAKHGGRSPALSSVILIVDGRCHDRSRAVFEILRRLDAPWSLLSALRVVPRPIADRVYDFVGAHRYRWFGRRSQCWVPDADARDRFLD